MTSHFKIILILLLSVVSWQGCSAPTLEPCGNSEVASDDDPLCGLADGVLGANFDRDRLPADSDDGVEKIDGAYTLQDQAKGSVVIDGGAVLKNMRFTKLCIDGAAFLNNVFVEGPLEINGSAEIHNIRAKSLKVKGTLIFKNLTVEGKVVIDGLADGIGLAASSLKVDGLFVGQEVNVSGGVVFSGGYEVRDSSFTDVEVSALKAYFRNTPATGVISKKQ